MGRMQLYYRVVKYYLTGNIINAGNIGNSYSQISSGYNDRFLATMQQYSNAMLKQLHLSDNTRVLDLACGTGVNTEWILKKNPTCRADAVDISEGMLKQAGKRLEGRANLIQESMLEYVKHCPEGYYDTIICGWALKYEPPVKLLSECYRILKAGGQIAVIVNTKKTLPEIRQIYKHLLVQNSDRINKLMLELPNPRDGKQLERWYKRTGFKSIQVFEGKQKFTFPSASELVGWVTSTGALAGFDIMLDLRDKEIKDQIAGLFEQRDISSITHDFVWGVAKKC